MTDNSDELNQALDSNATKDTNIDHNSSATETDSSSKDEENEESKNE